MRKSITRLSKFLSYILRHDPSSIGITLKDGGWVEIDSLIDAINNSNQPYEIDKKTLEFIVETDEKQRYSISDGLIRANQGHSIDNLNMDYKQIEPPSVLYHGTSEHNYNLIKADGFVKPMSRQYVHLSESYDTAKTVGSRHGKPVVLKLDTVKAQQEGIKFYRSANNVYLTDNNINIKFFSL